jgi:hypothetical protein
MSSIGMGNVLGGLELPDDSQKNSKGKAKEVSKKEPETYPPDQNLAKTKKDNLTNNLLSPFSKPMKPEYIQIGVHDEGYLDAENEIMANKAPLAKNMNIEDAVAKAKNTPGAEIVVVDAAGKANVHALTIKDDFYKENKTVDIGELKMDKDSDDPLLIENNVAGKLNGEAAFIVDQKDKVAYIGADVFNTTAATAMKDAEKFLKNPDKNKIDTAYQIADKFKKRQELETKFTRNLLTDFQKTGDMAALVNGTALVKPGKVKTDMESLIKELGSGNLSKEDKLKKVKAKLAE